VEVKIMASEKVISSRAVKGDKVNTIVFTKTVEIEKDYNEVKDDERRLISYIAHIKKELASAEKQYTDILKIKTDLGIE
jgi:hypothetical protein